MKNLFSALPAFLILLFSPFAASEVYVPDELTAWKAWVLEEHQHRRCPLLYADNQYACVWPSSLEIKAGRSGASFEQRVEVFADSWVALPGSQTLWPLGVTVSGRDVPVRLGESGKPQVHLSEGEHTLRGEFKWQKPPNHIPLPEGVAIVSLSVEGQRLKNPEIDSASRLWLRAATEPSGEQVRNTESLKVHRLIEDGNPAVLVTRLTVEVSGQAREIRAGKFLLDNFVPLSLTSPLPAKIEPDGDLRMQVRPGRWVVELKARHKGPLNALAYTRNSSLWPATELWSFRADSSLRAVQVQGPPSIDPNQTTIPKDWLNLPGYRLRPDEALTFIEVPRGDALWDADELRINRNIYLDFNGAGLTVNDHISGAVKQSLRLDAQADFYLGSASVNSEPQLITLSPEGAARGIEIRIESINMEARGRYDNLGEISLSGWQHRFNHAEATFHLPPGWSLFAAFGADRVSHSWMSKWNLWGIFVLLITVVSVHRLYGLRLAGLAAMTLLLVYHRSDAPILIWLNLIAVLALLSVAQGKLRLWLSYYQRFSFLILVLILLPFAMAQLREALYPQLKPELSNKWVHESRAPNLPDQAELASPAGEEELSVADPKTFESSISRPRQEFSRSSKKVQSLALTEQVQRDAEAIVQTGPGLPEWHWEEVAIILDGPVSEEELFTFYLVPPWLNRVGNLLAVLSSIIFATMLLLKSKMLPLTFAGRLNERFISALLPLVLPLLLVSVAVLSFSSPIVQAQSFPDSELLKELEKKLTRDPSCIPNCASIEQAAIAITPNSLPQKKTAKGRSPHSEMIVTMTVDVQEEVAMGLPAWRNTWIPESVVMEGRSATLRFADNGQLLVRLLKGRHTLVLRGSVLGESIDLRFGMPVPHVEAEITGWEISGVRDGGTTTGSVQLRRLQKTGEVDDRLLPEPVPPFVRINRRLDFGLEWSVITTVERVAPLSGAISLQVPLLKGESPLTELPQKDRHLEVTLGPKQRYLSWQSTLSQTEVVELVAPQQHQWSETWSIVAAPIWNTTFAGIVPLKKANSTLHFPEWAPWPGESLIIKATRPETAEGATLTIDQVSVTLNVGQRSNLTELDFYIRTSRGENFPFTLPKGAELDSLLVNGVSQPLLKKSGTVDVPLTPGSQHVEMRWQDESGVGVLTSMPRLYFGQEVSNIHLTMQVPSDRWSLFVGGPVLGPAVLLWSVIFLVALVAFPLGKSSITPLRFHHWLLLGIGISTVNTYGSLLIVLWLFAMGYRGRVTPPKTASTFRLMQIALLILSAVALITLLAAIPMSLLSAPDMHVIGNSSSAHALRWYQDRSSGVLPRAWLVSMPLYVYRIIMLLWALWLAVSLLNWLKWSWQQLNVQGFWRTANDASDDVDNSRTEHESDK